MALYRIDITHDTAFNECIIQLTLPTLDADFASDLSNLQFVQDGTILEHKVDDIVTRVVRVKLLYLNNGTTTIYLRPGPDVGAGTVTSITYIEDFDSTPSNLVTVCANTDYTISNGLLRVNNNTVALGPFNDDFRGGHLVKSRFRIPSDYSGGYGQVVSVTSVPYGVYKVLDTNGAWFAIYGLSQYFTGAQGSAHTYVLRSFSWNVATWYRATVQVAGSQVITQLLDDSESTVLASETIDIPGGPFTYALNYITFGAYIDPRAYNCAYTSAIDLEVDWVSYEFDASITPNNVTFTQESSNVIFGVSIPIYDVEHIHRLPELSRAPVTVVKQYPSKVITATQPMYLYELGIVADNTVVDGVIEVDLPTTFGDLWPSTFDYNRLQVWYNGHQLKHYVVDANTGVVRIQIPHVGAFVTRLLIVENVDSSITWSELSSASLTNINVAYVNRYEWTPYLFKYLTSEGAPPTTIYELYTAVFNKLQGLSHLTHISEIQTSTAHMKSPVCNIQSGNTHIDVRPVVESVSNIMTTYTHNTISTGQIMSKYIMSVDILNNITVYYSGLSASITQLLRKAMSLFARLSIVHSSADAVFIGSGEPIIMSASSINFVVKDMSVYGALYANVITTKDIKVLTDTIVWFSDTTIGAIQQPVVQSAYVIVQNTLDSIGSVAKYILTHIVTAHRELRVFPTRSTVHRAAHEYVLNQMSVQSTKYRLNTLSNNVTQEIITLTTTLATSATLTSVNSIMQYVVSKIKQLHSLHQLLSTHHLFELFGQILSTVKYRSIQSSLINSIWFVDIAVGGSAFATTHKAQDQFVEALKSTVTQEQWLTTLLNSRIVQTQYINNLLIDTHLYNIIHSNAHNILRWYQLTYGHTMFTGKSTVQAIPTQIITGTFIYSGINNALYNNNLYIRLTGDVISSILYKTTITGVHTSSSLYYQWLISTQVKMVQILSVILRTLVMDLPSLRSLVRDIALLRTKVID